MCVVFQDAILHVVVTLVLAFAGTVKPVWTDQQRETTCLHGLEHVERPQPGSYRISYISV